MKPVIFINAIIVYLFFSAFAGTSFANQSFVNTENNDWFTAERITLDNPVSDSIGSDGNINNWYKIAIPAYGIANFRLEPHSNFRVWIYVYGADNPHTAIKSDYARGSPVNVVTGLMPGEYFVRISRYSSTDFGVYTLTVNQAPEDQPNHDTSRQNDNHHGAYEPPEVSSNYVLTSNIGYFSQSGSPDMNDWYRITIPAYGVVTFELKPHSNFRVWIYVYGNDNPHTAIKSDYARGSPVNVVTGLMPGEYFVRISRYSSTDFGVYTLTVNQAPEDQPNHDTSRQNDNHHGAYEPPEVSSNYVLTSNIGYFSQSGSPDMNDWYKITIPTYAVVNFRLEPHSNFRVWIYIYRLDNPNTAIKSDYARGSPAMFSMALQAGGYFVRISRYSSSDFGVYTLNISIPHTVNATAGPGGSVSPASRSVYSGDTTTFTVTPSAGHIHGDVSGNCPAGSLNGNTYTTGPITSACTVNFSFIHVQYTISASADSGGNVTPISHTVDHGGRAIFTVTPDSGYRHGSVGGTCPSGSFNGNTYTTGPITSACTVSFSFTQVQHTVSANAGEGGVVTPDSQTVGHGSMASFTVTPNSGYSHDTTGGTCPSGSFNGNTYTTGSITSACTVSFSFTQVQHTVSANAGEGGVVTPDSRIVGHGSTASFTVTPDSGYSHGTTGGTCPSGSFNGNTYTTGPITSACTVSFSFTQVQHTVSANAGEGGVVTPDSRIVGHGSTASFTVTPNSGYSHGTTSGSCPTGSFNGNTYTTGSISSNCTVSFTFVYAQFIVSVSGNPAEGGTVSGGGSFAPGASVSVRATANAGYTFKNWTESGMIVSENSVYTFTLATDRYLTANFETDNQTGSLRVNIYPQEAVHSGAQWRRVGTFNWFDSGHTETGIATGAHSVEFKEITGWVTPDRQTVTVVKDNIATAWAEYSPETEQVAYIIATFSSTGIQYYSLKDGAWQDMYPFYPYAITAGDLDGDGIDDFIGAWQNAGVFAFLSGSRQWSNITSFQPDGIAAGDMTGNGRTDLIGRWRNFGLYYRNSVTGAWPRLVHTAPEAVAAGDVTGDGRNEMVGSWPGYGIYVRNVSNTWARISRYAPPVLGLGDMTGDGRKDYLCSWPEFGFYYLNSVRGDWWLLNDKHADMVAAGDLTGDGRDEVVAVFEDGVWIYYVAARRWEHISTEQPDAITTGRLSFRDGPF